MRLSSFLLLSISALGVLSTSYAAEKVITEKDKQSLNISVYNQNLALVKDVRRVMLEQGINDIAFEGVASNLKPETAILYSEGLRVLEQNYDYNLLSYENIISKSVGETVKTVTTNPTTGENIFNQAQIVATTHNYAKPILKFNYGIDANFPGRLVFEKLPEGLRSKPTLVAKVISNATQSKEVSLVYLTNGISWSTDYVAQIVDAGKLNLTGWVTINNESGIDYNNANVQLIAGNVNEVHKPVAYRGMMLKSVAMNTMADGEATAAPIEQDLSGYHMYSLPAKTTIKDKQTKQISLIEKNNVIYKKEARITPQLYFNPSSQSKFEQTHPEMYYIINNQEDDNLGIQLPSGTIRFYENDDNGNLQFIGENSIGHVAKGELMRLHLGSFVNIFASGKINKIEKISENESPTNEDKCRQLSAMYNYQAEVTIRNSGKNAQEVIYTQNLPQDAQIVQENIKGNLKNSGVYEWKTVVAPDSSATISYAVNAPNIRRICK